MEVLKLSIQEALITMFTDGPINWLKWAVVFAVLIVVLLVKPAGLFGKNVQEKV